MRPPSGLPFVRTPREYTPSARSRLADIARFAQSLYENACTVMCRAGPGLWCRGGGGGGGSALKSGFLMFRSRGCAGETKSLSLEGVAVCVSIGEGFVLTSSFPRR